MGCRFKSCSRSLFEGADASATQGSLRLSHSSRGEDARFSTEEHGFESRMGYCAEGEGIAGHRAKQPCDSTLGCEALRVSHGGGLGSFHNLFEFDSRPRYLSEEEGVNF
jgi:hypothetical protein